MESIEITYFRSSLCPNMLFGSKEDTENFDETLKRYSENPEAEKEFRKAASQYPSPYAVDLAIKQNRFHFNLVGEYSDELIAACENMTGGYDGLADDECYICAMNYLYNKFYCEKSNEKKLLEIVMTRKEEINVAASKYGYIAISDYKDAFIEGADWADSHPVNVWHDASNEIKELIIHCVDKCAEREMYPKDIFNEIYEYIDKWYKDENLNNL